MEAVSLPEGTLSPKSTSQSASPTSEPPNHTFMMADTCCCSQERTVGRPAKLRSTTGLPIFTSSASNCLDVSNGPLYPFGYGLSYTTFDYSNFKISSQEAGINGNQEATEWQDGKKITATITVKNTGARDADEVVQLYIRDLVASISRPVKELKGFQRIHLAAGESKEVSFDITPNMLKFYNAELKHVIEPGDFQIMVGTNSKEVKTLKFRVR